MIVMLLNRQSGLTIGGRGAQVCWAGAGMAAPGGNLRKPKETTDDVSQVGNLDVGPDMRNEQEERPLGPTPGAGTPGAAVMGVYPSHSQSMSVHVCA